jgi:hypothetical protein
MRPSITCLALTTIVAFASPAFAAPMAFRLASDGTSAGEPWIVADGSITADTADDLRRFLAANRIAPGRRIEVFLNSAGGNLMGGVKLGETIREFGLGTRVARSLPVAQGSNQAGGSERQAVGECYSACAFAFMGGKWRNATNESLGVHQHYKADALRAPDARQFSGSDLSASLVMSGVLTDFVARMGVDSRVLALAAVTRPDGIYRLTTEELVEYSLVFNDLAYGDWKLEPVKDGLVARADTKNGENRATLYCRGDEQVRLLVSAPYQSKFSDAAEIIAGARVQLFGADIPATDIAGQIADGRLLFEFRLPANFNADASPKEGLAAFGVTRALFAHALPKKDFTRIVRLVAKNCVEGR